MMFINFIVTYPFFWYINNIMLLYNVLINVYNILIFLIDSVEPNGPHLFGPFPRSAAVDLG